MPINQKQEDLVRRINRLKKKKNAVILAHNYQKPEVFKVADFIGDSLKLCQQAAKTDAKIILFCGVDFMAESAAILNPKKKVIVPYIDAGCSMANMVDASEIKKFRKKNPDVAIVCYINSTAETKAVCDICCTSSNAVKIVKSLKEKKVLFIPDKNLAKYVASQVPEKEIIAWEGFCPIHQNLRKKSVEEIKKLYPKAKIIAHPECRPEVLELADYVTSTGGMIDVAKNDQAKDFFVITECGMTERLKLAVPNKNFQGLCNICYDMKKNDLEAILKALETEKTVVTVDKKSAAGARKTFDRMFAVT